jgi:hypothetical protein
LIDSPNSLLNDRCDTGRAFGPGDSSKLFRGYLCEWNPGSFQSSNEFSGKRIDQQFLAVEQSVYREPVIHRCYEVAHAFNKEMLA